MAFFGVLSAMPLQFVQANVFMARLIGDPVLFETFSTLGQKNLNPSGLYVAVLWHTNLPHLSYLHLLLTHSLPVFYTHMRGGGS